MENQVKTLLERGEEKATIARFALDAVIDVVSRPTSRPGGRGQMPLLMGIGIERDAQASSQSPSLRLPHQSLKTPRQSRRRRPPRRRTNNGCPWIGHQ